MLKQTYHRLSILLNKQPIVSQVYIYIYIQATRIVGKGSVVLIIELAIFSFSLFPGSAIIKLTRRTGGQLFDTFG